MNLFLLSVFINTLNSNSRINYILCQEFNKEIIHVEANLKLILSKIFYGNLIDEEYKYLKTNINDLHVSNKRISNYIDEIKKQNDIFIADFVDIRINLYLELFKKSNDNRMFFIFLALFVFIVSFICTIFLFYFIMK